MSEALNGISDKSICLELYSRVPPSGDCSFVSMIACSYNTHISSFLPLLVGVDHVRHTLNFNSISPSLFVICNFSSSTFHFFSLPFLFFLSVLPFHRFYLTVLFFIVILLLPYHYYISSSFISFLTVTSSCQTQAKQYVTQKSSIIYSYNINWALLEIHGKVTPVQYLFSPIRWMFISLTIN